MIPWYKSAVVAHNAPKGKEKHFLSTGNVGIHMRIKVYLALSCLWLSILCCAITAKPSTLTYMIRFDSETKNSAAIKQEVIERYGELIRGVHEESEAVLLIHNLDLFMWEEDMQADWKDNTLLITIGDGKGAIISGDLDPQEICLPQVKTKSLFQEWFSGS